MATFAELYGGTELKSFGAFVPDDDDLSECGSEDVDVLPHRFGPPTLPLQDLGQDSKPELVSHSLADEIKMSLAMSRVLLS